MFQEPPPTPLPKPSVAPAPAAPEAAIGSFGPQAVIADVRSVATGAPVELGAIDSAFSVMVLVARGPGEWLPDSNARIELVLTGPDSATFTKKIDYPAPTIIAHNFAVAVRRDDGSGLRSGLYRMRVRLIMRDNTALTESVSLSLQVR